MTCVKGKAKLIVSDEHAYRIIYMGEHAPKRVHIPAGLWHGFKGFSEEEALIINLPNKMFNYEEPDEPRLPPNSLRGCSVGIWERKDG